jgi:hypothetical protein
MRAKQAGGRRRILCAVATALLLAMPLVVPAIGEEKTRRRGQEVRGEDDIRETIQVLMLASMKKSLELSRDQEMEVVPRVQLLLEERERFARERRVALRRLQIKVLEEAPDDREFRGAVAQLDQMEKAHHELEARLRSGIDQSLNARQQAELRLFVPRFRQEMMRRIEQARRVQERRAPAAPAPPDDPLLGDDDF